MDLLRILFVCAAVALAGCGGGGGGTPASPPPVAANTPPTAAITMMSGVRTNAATGAMIATVGALIELTSTGSTDPDNDSLSMAWSLVSRPTGSIAVLTASGGTRTTLSPDRLGDYLVSLIVSDGRGGTAEKRVTITADNQAPSGAVVVSITFAPTPTVLPTQAVVLGASIVMSAAASTDPNGDALTYAWSIIEGPTGSSAALDSTTGSSARFSPDRLGLYRVRCRVTDARGAYQETIAVFDANNQAPDPVLASTVTPRAGGSTTIANVSVGYDVVLSAAGSTDPDGDTLTYTWVLTGRPTGSAVALSFSGGPSTLFAPDTMGVYTVALRAQDSRGAFTEHTVSVQVNNRRPVIALTSNSTPVPVASIAPIRVPIGTEVTLNGGDSRDADGDALSFSWTVNSRPSGSSASINTGATSAQARFVPDVGGSYAISLRVTDSKGAFAEQSLIVDVGNYAPRAVLDKERVVVVVGTSVQATGALSFDDDGDALTFSWSLQSKPSSSTLALSSTSSSISFTPDVAGTYVLTMTVDDGKQTTTSYLTVLARASALTTVNLSFVPLGSAYSKGLDVLVLTADSPPSVRIVDSATGVVRSLVLPLSPRSIAISPNGKRAAVLHSGSVSYVNLETTSLVRTVMTGGDRTEVFLRDDAQAYVIGQVGGQWVNPRIQRFNLETGVELPATPPVSSDFAYFYGTQRGVFAPLKNKAFFVADNLSPSDISFFTLDATGSVLSTGDSPYHGDFLISSPLWLTTDQNILFTSAGTYFSTDSVTHAGTLQGLSGTARSMSHSAELDELLLIDSVLDYGSGYPWTEVLPDTYLRFSSPLFAQQPSLPFPQIGGGPSYGVSVFHSNAGHHVLLVQTGSPTLRGPGAAYHVVYR